MCQLCNSELSKNSYNESHYYCPNREKIIFNEFISSTYTHYNLHVYMAAELKEAIFAYKQELFKLTTYGHRSYLEVRAEDGGWDMVYTFDFNMPISIKSIDRIMKINSFI